MKKKYRLFRRAKVFWVQDNETGKQESLRTRERVTAERLLHARNEAHHQPLINLQIARSYLLVGDPQAATRTWQVVMDEIVKLKHGVTQTRWQVAIKEKALDCVRNLSVLETRAEHFLRALERGGVATNVFLRRIHNFALGMNWLPVPVIPKRQWPNVRYKEKRAITLNEHQSIVTWETNPERRAFYELAWHLGASQSDIAFLEAENIDWDEKLITYARKKTGERAFIRFGNDLTNILHALPATGPLFPYLRTVRAGDRATEFKQRCDGLGIKGVSLHSYRYAWAERAKKAGYPERFAQIALGHNSKAVHRAYARKAEVVIPTLESYEKQMIQHSKRKIAKPRLTVLSGAGTAPSPTVPVPNLSIVES